MKRHNAGFTADDGTVFGPDSIVVHLHHAFGIGREDMAYSLAQHAAEHVAELVSACQALVDILANGGDPIARADAVEHAEATIRRAQDGPAWAEPDWDGAPFLSADLDAMYSEE